MSWFRASAVDRARRASVEADRAQEALKESAKDLGEMERRLFAISKELPDHAPEDMTSGMYTSMVRARRHAERTLHHLRRLQQHIDRAETGLRQQKRQGHKSDTK